MRDDAEIEVGEKVDLVKEKGRIYKTMVEDMYGGGSFLVGVPSHGGVPMLTHVDDEVLMIYYRESGRYVAPMRVAAFEKKGEVRYMLLIQKADPYRDQRRGAFRLPTKLKVQICEYIEGFEDAFQGPDGYVAFLLESVGSIDLSLTGIAMMTKKQYGLGENYVLKLSLDGQQEKQPFTVCAKVVRSSPGPDKGTFNVGMQFFGMSKSMNEFMYKYVLEQQQKQIKLRKQNEST